MDRTIVLKLRPRDPMSQALRQAYPAPTDLPEPIERMLKLLVAVDARVAIRQQRLGAR